MKGLKGAFTPLVRFRAKLICLVHLLFGLDSWWKTNKIKGVIKGVYSWKHTLKRWHSLIKIQKWRKVNKGLASAFRNHKINPAQRTDNAKEMIRYLFSPFGSNIQIIKILHCYSYGFCFVFGCLRQSPTVSHAGAWMSKKEIKAGRRLLSVARITLIPVPDLGLLISFTLFRYTSVDVGQM